MILRDYQTEASDSIIEKWRTHQSTLLVKATGLGKTIVFAEIIKRMQPRRALVLAHREELIFQARNKIEQCTGLPCDIEMASMKASSNLFHKTPVVISTIQTQTAGRNGSKRMHRFNPNDFGVVVVDESHHCTSKSYRSVLDHYKQNPDLKILGVTATPDRTDQESLGQIFECVAADYGILYGIEHGWLCDITQQFIPVSSLDYSHVRTTAGDLNSADLRTVMEEESNIMGVCQPSLEVMFGLEPHTLDQVEVEKWGEFLMGLGRPARRTIIFTASVNQAEACCNIFNRVNSGLSKWVCGKTDKDERRDTLKSFASGETRAVANCGVLTEGFDDPGVEVVIMARPTKSRSLYAQMVGRCTRPLPGVVDHPELDTPDKRRDSIAASEKPFCRIIDFVGNSGRHKLVTCMDILGGKTSDKARDRAIKDAQQGDKPKPVRVTRALTRAEVDIAKEEREAAEKARRAEAARRAKVLARARYSSHRVDPFGNGGPTLYRGWRGGKQLSIKQRNFLRRHCNMDPDRVTYAEGAKAIRDKINSWGK